MTCRMRAASPSNTAAAESMNDSTRTRRALATGRIASTSACMSALSDGTSAPQVVAHAREVQGLLDLAHAAGVPKNASEPLFASGVDFVLEGLYAMKKISRSEERGYHASEPAVRRPAREAHPFSDETPMPTGGGKKKYYN